MLFCPVLEISLSHGCDVAWGSLMLFNMVAINCRWDQLVIVLLRGQLKKGVTKIIVSDFIISSSNSVPCQLLKVLTEINDFRPHLK
jgi:hypothetical protein